MYWLLIAIVASTVSVTPSITHVGTFTTMDDCQTAAKTVWQSGAWNFSTFCVRHFQPPPGEGGVSKK
jgi:hypothetical protein